MDKIAFASTQHEVIGLANLVGSLPDRGLAPPHSLQ